MPLEFECPVCLETEDVLRNRDAFENLAMLPVCGHWICQDCLHQLVNPRGFDPAYIHRNCPLCRAPFTVPAEDQARRDYIWSDAVFRPERVMLEPRTDSHSPQRMLIPEYEEYVLGQLLRSTHLICQQIRTTQLAQSVIPENLQANLANRPSKIMRALTIALLKAHALPALQARFGNPTPQQFEVMVNQFIRFGVHCELIPGIVRPGFDPRSGSLFRW